MTHFIEVSEGQIINVANVTSVRKSWIIFASGNVSQKYNVVIKLAGQDEIKLLDEDAVRAARYFDSISQKLDADGKTKKTAKGEK